MRRAYASHAASAIIGAARAWRVARDQGEPVQPILSLQLSIPGSGFLAPVFDGLLTLFEAAFRRRFEAGAPGDKDMTSDERRLLKLLESDDPQVSVGVRPNLAAVMRTAVRSTRIMLRAVLTPASGEAAAC